MKKRIISFILCIAMCLSTVALFSSCGGGNKADSLVIMTDELDGLFNPFYSTTAADGTIVSMTQIGMLTSKYVNGNVEVAYGDNEAVVVKDYKMETNGNGDDKETVYTFVLKNGIKFSNGSPLTMNDVLFNMYVYLDPVYAGSSTMYSTKIQGLTAYRTQTEGADSDSDADSELSDQASTLAESRLYTLINYFREVYETTKAEGKVADEAAMKAYLSALTDNALSGYISTVVAENKREEFENEKKADKSSWKWSDQIISDYEYILKLYREELDTAFATAMDAFTEAPYSNHDEFKDQIFCFMYSQGYVEVTYVKVNGRDDKSQIESLRPMYGSHITTKEQAIEYAFNDTICNSFDAVSLMTGAATTVLSEYTANAKGVILHEKLGDSNELIIPSISGIVSLGHSTDVSSVTIGDKTYNVAKEYNDDGTVKNAEGENEEYAVLQITIDGVDPKAIWNFSFPVAPQFYYGDESLPVNIKENKFGVDWGEFSFMTDIIQAPDKIKLPVGAGAYKATDRENNENPAKDSFYKDNVVYFKANNYFETVGSGLSNAKIEKVRYQVVGASNALAMLENGSIHYATPQATENNLKAIEDMTAKGEANYISVNQLGYGYIGINAGKVTDINVRKAIMCAMNTTLALDYYRTGTADLIYYSMSLESWAYPKDEGGNPVVENGKDYPQMNKKFDQEIAIANIKKYMEEAGYSPDEYNPELKFTFTIAGSNLQDHPTYKTFRDAAALLNSLGWDITVQADTQALTKLSTGSLTVWAAARGSTIDPDMYQVYHKNSTATSTLAWGYPSIKTSGSSEEQDILDELSDLIDEARTMTDQKERAKIYKQAMEKVLDLAIELPVYQRKVVYVYNSNVIDKDSLPSDVNPYSSPLDRIWELEFVG